jgi:hypothetical protein
MQLISAGLFAIIGIAMIVPARGTDVAEHVLGGVALTAGVVFGAACATNHVTLTPAGITYRYNFRRKTIPWETVGSFSVSPWPGNPRWSTVRVELRPVGYAHVKGVWGTKRYARELVAEFQAYQARLPAHFGAVSQAPQDTEPQDPA